MKEKIVVAWAADHTYASYMETSIISLLLNNARHSVSVNVLDVGLEKEDIECIRKSVEKNGGIFVYHNLRDIESILREGTPRFLDSFGTYARLFLPDLLPNEEKVLYLDCDTLIVDDIWELWNTDVSNYYLAGVKDTIGSPHRIKLALSEDDIYINAGVILINLRRWREEGIRERVLEFVDLNKTEITLPDQDGINKVCNGGILTIDARYNVLSPMYLMPYASIIRYFSLSDYYSKEEIRAAKRNPCIIHYTGYPDRRPWEKGCKHPMTKMYLSYAEKSSIGVSIRVAELSRRRKFVYFKLCHIPYKVYLLLRKLIKRR